VAGYALRSLFVGSALPAPVVGKQIVAAAKQEQQQQLKQYEARMEQMTKQHAKLDEQLTATRQELAKAKTVHIAQTTAARRLTSRQQANADTTVGNCDSLATATLQLIAAGEAQDSLYQQTITLMEQKAANKDSVILFQKERVDELQQSLASAMRDNQQLAETNNALLKQIKRHNRKQRLLSAMALIASGAAAYGLVK
jgi:hypothetical protein